MADQETVDVTSGGVGLLEQAAVRESPTAATTPPPDEPLSQIASTVQTTTTEQAIDSTLAQVDEQLADLKAILAGQLDDPVPAPAPVVPEIPEPRLPEAVPPIDPVPESASLELEATETAKPPADPPPARRPSRIKVMLGMPAECLVGVLVAADLPFSWMSESLKSILGYAGIATFILAVVVWVLGPTLF